MNKFLRSTLSLSIALILSASLAAPALASNALGEDLTAQSTEVGKSAVLSTDVFWSTTYSNLRTENLVTYTPNSAVTPLVTYGGVLTGRSTVSDTAKALEANGYRVIAGVNGDFYNTSNGLPIGIVVSDGLLKSTDAGYYAVGFKADGTAVMGKPAVKVSADLGYAAADSAGAMTEVLRNITAVNKARVSTGGIYLYTYDFNAAHTTGNTEEGVDVLCTVESGALSIGGSVTLRVESITQTTAATAIGQNQVVLSANAKSDAYYTAALLNAPVGGTISVTVSASSEEWNQVRGAVGALYALVQNGSVVSGLPAGSNPRTALGQKADGTLVFYTIDGRQSGYSIGATMTQVAERLVELGCTTALCLDGGGSTTLTVTQPDKTAAATVNRPSDSSERAVTNQIFLVAGNQSSGVLDHFYVSADSSYVLAGSQVNLSASAVDTNYIPMSSGYALSASAGTISGSVLTTPASGGDVTVTASGSGRSGSTVIHAVKTPDAISVKKGSVAVTSLTTTPGSTLSLKASAIYNHLSLKADASAFTWSLTGNIGTVDASGTLTAVTPGTGTLSVSAGGKSTTVQVTVGTVALSTLENFEGTLPAAAGYSYGGTLSANTDPNYVQYGRKSGKLDYTLSSDGTASLIFDTPYAIGTAYTQVNLWVYGDGSGNTLALLTSDGSAAAATDIGPLDFTGWKQLTVALPAGAASLTGFRISGSVGVTTDESGNIIVSVGTTPSGTLYLDQIVASYNGITDTAAPTVTASIADGVLSGTVADAADGLLPAGAVAVTVDGKSVAFNYTASTGKFSAVLSLPAGARHRVTVQARDASGNIGRASVDVDAYDTAHQFTDINDFWGSAYVDWLKTAGITSGYADGTFRPGRTITRQEFAVMLYRYLGLDGTQYESVTLPFADADKIGAYAQTAVKTLYSAGIIGGTEKDGQLYFYPTGSLTRAQAAAMIGRTQEKGYAAASLSFTDAASVPAYAAYYVQTMTAQGVISGYADGTFRPGAKITRGQMAKILYNLL